MKLEISVDKESRAYIQLGYGGRDCNGEHWEYVWISQLDEDARYWGRWSSTYDSSNYYAFGFWFFNVGICTDREIKWLAT
jgi:hypothetical protein